MSGCNDYDDIYTQLTRIPHEVNVKTDPFSRIYCESLNFILFIRTLGNIVTGNDTQTDSVLASNAVPVFAKLLQHPKMNIIKVKYWLTVVFM